jgi:hypothetical protein
MVKYSAVIVEPRKHKALSFVLNNFLENLSDDWLIIIIHGNNNSKFIDDIISNDLGMYNNRIAKINIYIENLNINEYNSLLTSKFLYNIIPTETILFFQTDTMILKKHKELIYKFIDYDYCGAPWIIPQFLVQHNIVGNCYVGNGGLSLRKKSICLDCINKYEWGGENEDIYFSMFIKNKPDKEEAKLFAIETIYNDVSFGLHKPWVHLKIDELQLLVNEYENLNELIRLNSC